MLDLNVTVAKWFCNKITILIYFTMLYVLIKYSIDNNRAIMKNNALFPIIKQNLNLLTSLYFLLKLKHISKAADQLFISQSAVSQQLARLRVIFDDNFLVRVNNEMVLTPVAIQILPLVEQAIKSSSEVFNMRTDEIVPSKTHYSICMVDGLAMEWVAQLLLNIANKYNNTVTFEIFNRYDECVRDLNQGKLDFLIGSFNDLSNNIHQIKLSTIHYSPYVNKNHPLAILNRPININEVFDYDLVEFKFQGKVGIAIEDYLRDIIDIRKKKVVLTFSQYDTMIELIKNNDCIGFLPDNILNIKDLKQLDIIETLPTGNSYMYWHSLVDHDAFHSYLRHQLINLSKENNLDV